VLNRIFEPKRDEVTGGWKKRHNEELHNLYSSPNTVMVMKSSKIRWAGHIAHMRNAHTILVVRPEGKRPRRSPRHRWEDNIKMDLGI
jgi:hypothetical protein